MSYQDRYKGRKIKDPPFYLGRFGLFILVVAAFAFFVGTLRGLDSSLCALATLTVVAFKLLVELIAGKAKFKLPERFANLPLYVWLLFWLLPIPPLWFVLRTVWPKNADPNGMMGFLTLVCLVLYVPTLLAIFKPIETKKTAKEETEETSGAEKINFDVDFNVPEPDSELQSRPSSQSTDKNAGQPAKSKSKAKRKRK
ncbi:MAG: hypothetical protein C0507_06065 [Cyanobacteria bacterium PR.3.49]|nr:hypothetical protein [Cyanobacteria bacterium PR.3.49]